MNDLLECTEIWRKYETGVSYMHKIDLVDRTDKAHRFYSGDQWYGLKSGGEELPSQNFIKGIVKYKVGVVAQNTMTAVYSSIDSMDEMAVRACELLGKYFAVCWERGKMDSMSWKIIKDAAIQGDAYIFFGEGSDLTKSQIIDNVNIFLGDEQCSELQKQPYIIIRERRFIEDIKREARENGIEEKDLDLIVSDDELQDQLGDKQEVDYTNKDGKCISLLYMEKDEEGYVHISRSVKNLIYQKDTILKGTKNGEEMDIGLKSYPIANFIWEDKKGSGRGFGEVEFLIPNQIEVNKTLARRSIAVKQTAYPKMAYADGLVLNPDELDIVGGKIAVTNGNAQSINQIVGYLNPAQISPDAKYLSDELINQSKELAGAGDSATGAVDPTQASGTAIMAVRDQAALPLNEQLARYSQFVEDLAYLWFDIWLCYETDGLEVEYTNDNNEVEKDILPSDILQNLKFNVKVDVSKTNPFSLYAMEQNLINLWTSQAISFEEMVEALPEGSTMPKGALQEILKKRQIEEQKQMQIQMQMDSLMQQNSQYAMQLQQMTEALNSATAQAQNAKQIESENVELKRNLGESTQALNSLMNN